MDQVRIINDNLRNNNALLIIKIHPMQDINTVKITSLSNILVIDGDSVKHLGIDNYRLMKDVDALISDYSSAAYDFLHTGKPIAYTLDDVENYSIGLIVDNPKSLMAGHIIYTQIDFINFINDIIENKDPYKSSRKVLFDKVFKYHDGLSSQRLTELLKMSRIRLWHSHQVNLSKES